MSEKSSSGGSVNIRILLTEEQRGPFPIDVESLWFKPEGDYYVLKNTPFFIDNLSYDDVVSIEPLSEDLYQIREIVKPSLNSTVWVYLNDELEGYEIIKRLKSMGCGVETGVIDGYYAVNVPENSDYVAITKLLEEDEKKGIILVNYASVRC